MSSSKADILRTSREKEKRLHYLRIFLGVVLIIVILVGFFLILNLDFLRVNKIIVKGQTSADKLEIEQLIEKHLSGNYLVFIPRDSIFFISKQSILVTLARQYPGLKETSISWPNLNTLEILVADEALKVLWCIDKEKVSDCYYLTSGGLAYQLAPNFSNYLFTEIHTKQPLPQRSAQVISPLSLSRVIKVVSFVRENLALWPNSGTKFLYVKSYAREDFVIYLADGRDGDRQLKIFFSTKQDAGAIITALNSVLKNKNFLTDWRQYSGHLEYIDLRFPGKIFYRFN